MAPPQQARVLRCCCCSLFQAHQVKKSLKWTCKACGKKQSFLQAYGEGSGADCRRHVQKLNLLQGQISEMSLRSLGESISANEEENVGPWQAARASPQETLQPSKNRWLKYLERDSKELGLKGGGVCFNSQPSSETEKPDPPFSTGLPRKRKWNQSTVQPLCGPHVQDSRNCEVTLKSLKARPLHPTWGARSSPDCSTWDLPCISEELPPSFTQDRAGLAGKGRESSREDLDTTELVPGGNHRVLPSRSGPCLSGNNVLEAAHIWTQSPSPLCREASGQSRQHRLSRGPPGPRLQGKEASAGSLVHASLLRPHTLPCLGPSGSVGGSLSSHRAQAPGQRVCPWSKGCRHVLHSCVCVTFLKLERTLMTICELKLVCYSCRHICHMNPSIQ